MGKFGWDLPPGVTTSMLPGNSPEEQELETFYDLCYEKFMALGLELPETRAELLADFILEIRSAAYKEGYDQGQSDAQLYSGEKDASNSI